MYLVTWLLCGIVWVYLGDYCSRRFRTFRVCFTSSGPFTTTTTTTTTASVGCTEYSGVVTILSGRGIQVLD